MDLPEELRGKFVMPSGTVMRLTDGWSEKIVHGAWMRAWRRVYRRERRELAVYEQPDLGGEG